MSKCFIFSKTTGYAYNDLICFIKEATSFNEEERFVLKNYEKELIQSVEKTVQYEKLDSSLWLKKNDCIGDLTEKEQEVLNLLLKGYSYQECAEILVNTSSTIKTHVNNIMQKRNVHSLQELIVLELTGQLKNKVVKKEIKNNNEIFKLINTLMK